MKEERRLSNSELLTKITGVSQDITTKLCKDGLYTLRRRADQLEMVFGLSKSDARKIHDALDFATRMNLASPPVDYIKEPRQVYELLRPEVIGAKQEMVFLVMLDESGNVIDYKMMAKGTAIKCQIPIAQILRESLLHNADSVILAHNHPSGDATPSPADVRETVKLGHLMKEVGIELLDHIILTDNEYRAIDLEEDLQKCPEFADE